MNKTKIEWVKNPDGSQGFSCNPFSGLCPVGCWYCYGKGFVKRFEKDERVKFWMHRLDKIRRRKKPAGIFMCSKFELFYPCTEGFYRNAIFGTIEACPQHRFYILTKFPQNIDRPMPENVWLGVTVTKRDELHKIIKLRNQKAKIKFISFEPVLENLPIWWGGLSRIDWIIIGKLTGFGRKHEPSNHVFKRRLASIFLEAKRHDIPIFLKDNLKEIWGDNNLIQEFPREEKC